MFSKNAVKSDLIINEIAVGLRKSAKARRVIIKIRHGQVQLIIPRYGSVSKAIRFFKAKEDWIISKLANQPDKIPLKIGATVPLLGIDHKIIYGGVKGKSTRQNTQLIIYGDVNLAAKKIKKLVSEYLKTELSKILGQKTNQLAVSYKKLTIRDNVSRWGSCSSKGTLSFCWRLVFAPREVIEYLACHELAHLREMNHGENFWRLVESLYPGYRTAEAWLKENSNNLHLYN